jgi:hypothetical protein
MEEHLWNNLVVMIKNSSGKILKGGDKNPFCCYKEDMQRE